MELFPKRLIKQLADDPGELVYVMDKLVSQVMDYKLNQISGPGDAYEFILQVINATESVHVTTCAVGLCSMREADISANKKPTWFPDAILSRLLESCIFDFEHNLRGNADYGCDQFDLPRFTNADPNKDVREKILGEFNG
jgi:hypothetical protein